MPMEQLGRVWDLGWGTGLVDASGGAQTGKRVYLGDTAGATLIIVKNVEAGTDDPVFTLKSWVASSGGSTDPAGGPKVDHYYYKAHATAPETASWVRVSQAASATVTLTSLAALQGFVAVYVGANSLSDTYKYVSADIADAGSTLQLATSFWVLGDINVGRAPAKLAKTLR